MKESVMDKKWKAYKTEGSNGFFGIGTIDGYVICTAFSSFAVDVANYIVKIHNESLDAKEWKPTMAKRVRVEPNDGAEPFEATVIEEYQFLYVVEPDGYPKSYEQWNKKVCIVID